MVSSFSQTGPGFDFTLLGGPQSMTTILTDSFKGEKKRMPSSGMIAWSLSLSRNTYISIIDLGG